MTSYFIVSISYRVVDAASPREADERDAREHAREGEGFSMVVESEREVKAILALVVPHVGVSANGAVSVTMKASR